MRRTLIPMTAAILLAPAIPAVGGAQEAQRRDFGEQIEVRVVELEVSVRDRNGIPVTGLEKGDFRLLVDGRPVAIDSFEERGRRAIDLSPEGDAPSPPVDGGLSILVYLDEEFSLEIDLERVLTGMERQLSELGPADRVALVAWDGHRLSKLLDWTPPGPEVAAALAAAKQRASWGLRTGLDEASWRAQPLSFNGVTIATDFVAANCFGYAARGSESCAEASLASGRPADRMRVIEVEHRIDRTARAVAAATRSMTPPPGRRILALLSGGWSSGSRNAEGRLGAWDPILDVADELRYSIYAVDVPGGGSNSFSWSDESRDPVNGTWMGSGSFRTPASYTLRYLADSTGGRALVSGERRELFTRAARDARSYYSIAFVAPRERNDASHAIRVELERAALEVRHRAAYRDLSDSTVHDYALETALLDATAGTGADSLQASLGAPVRARIGRVDVPLRVSIPPRSPEIANVPRDLELRIAAVDGEGRRVLVGPVSFDAEGSESVDLSLRLRRTSQDLAISLLDRSTGESRMATLRLEP